MVAVFPMAAVMLQAEYINPVAVVVIIPVASTAAMVATTAVILTIEVTTIPAVAVSPKPAAMGAFAVTITHQAVVALPNTAARPVI